MAKAVYKNKKRESLHQQIGYKLKETPNAFLHLEHSFV